jgi:mxaJ protein
VWKVLTLTIILMLVVVYRVVWPPQRAPEKPEDAVAAHRVLRVCADPNNLPFSNRGGEGFENKLAEILAQEMGADLEYTWWAQQRGYLRNTTQAGLCDVWPGMATSIDRVLVTAPYYRSGYVFVTRADIVLPLESLDSPLLRRLRVGVHLIGDDGANTPPVHALHRRQIVNNVVGYHLFGDYNEPDPPARLLEAVANGEVDVAIAWGPLAGYFTRSHRLPLRYQLVSPAVDLPFLPMVYDVSVGVRRGRGDLRNQIDGILVRKRAEIEQLLNDFGIPRLDESGELLAAAGVAQ